MPVKPRASRRAVLALGAITGYVAPKLAQDQKFDATGVKAVLQQTTRDNWLKQKPRLATAIQRAGGAMFANDADLEGIHALLDSLDKEEGEDEDVTDTTGLDEEKETDEEKEARDARRAADRAMGRDCASDEEGETEEEKKHRMEARDRRAKDARMGKDADPEEKKKAEDEHRAMDKKAWDERMGARDAARGANDRRPVGITQAAMDSAIRSAEKRTEDRVIARMRSMSEAQATVMPYVGPIDIAAFDSADEIHRFALEKAEVEVPAEATGAVLAAMVKMLPKPGDRLAADSRFSGGGGGSSADFMSFIGTEAQRVLGN